MCGGGTYQLPSIVFRSAPQQGAGLVHGKLVSSIVAAALMWSQNIITEEPLLSRCSVLAVAQQKTSECLFDH